VFRYANIKKKPNKKETRPTYLRKYQFIIRITYFDKRKKDASQMESAFLFNISTKKFYPFT